MATYVLVAGAWHGSWCWSEVVPLLEAAGHRVLAPDLRGMKAGEPTETEEPLRKWADQIADLIAARNEPVILVGHSRAGIVISEVAERVPDRIALLVYLSAYLLQDGETLNDIAQRAFNIKALTEAVIVNDDGTCTLDRSAVKDFLYNKTPDPLLEIARARLVPEPLASFTTPLHVTEERFGSVPRAYVECTDDYTVPIANQHTMQQAAGITITERLDSDHSPFFSQPRELVQALERIRGRA